MEHEINPTGSALWNELSLIASGDLSIDELLVSRVTTDLQDKLGAAPPRPIVFCARARFGLLGQGGHWFPGQSADLLDHAVQEAELREALAGSPWADHIPGLLRRLRDRLGGQPINRLMTS